jgi:hypothetical protein
MRQKAATSEVGLSRYQPSSLGEIVWETVRDGHRMRYKDEPETGFRRRFVAELLKLPPIDSQL